MAGAEDDRGEADGRYDVADGMSPGGVIRRSEPIAQSDADKHEKQACPQSMDELVTMCVDAHGVAASRSWDWDARLPRSQELKFRRTCGRQARDAFARRGMERLPRTAWGLVSA